jgi:acyl-CoA thioester hydrolase
MFETKIKTRYAETDQMGVIHHSVYPIYYEAARVDFCEKIGLPFHKIEEMGLMQALKTMTCEYIASAYFGDELLIQLTIAELTKVKVTFTYQIFNQHKNLIHEASTKLVWLDKSFKICNIEKKYPVVYEAMKNAFDHQPSQLNK